MRARGLPRGRRLALLAPFAWLIAFFAAPLAIVVKIALSRAATAQPPYEPTFDVQQGLAALLESASQLSLESFGVLFEDSIYLDSVLSSLRLAGLSTLLALLIAYPLALAIARAPQRWRPALVLLAIAPFWTSFLIRVYAWIAILKDEGLLNHALLALGVIGEPLRMFATEGAVVVGIVYSYLPFMVLPIFNAIDRQEPALVEAAMDLGATRAGAFWTVTFPLSRPGIVAGALLVFIPALGEFVIPDLLGGSDTLMIGRTLWNEFFANRDWPVASAAALALLALLLAPLIAFERAQMRREGAS
ncbi:MAG: putrescine transporter permease [Hyphomicrobiales bacterium]|nr:putrescine transporter permease [Hyphomicrobiales bacterium]